MNANEAAQEIWLSGHTQLRVTAIVEQAIVDGQADLLAACTRMMVGITGKSTADCEWYEGIEHDGADEAHIAIAKAKRT